MYSGDVLAENDKHAWTIFRPRAHTIDSSVSRSVRPSFPWMVRRNDFPCLSLTDLEKILNTQQHKFLRRSSIKIIKKAFIDNEKVGLCS